ncbi:MAG: HAMP domain-containing histidine kinase [Oscillospiraceae bacterium]|nr:HAMP domain-containing histidine kinase [Oscillospiraceae bacterium]
MIEKCLLAASEISAEEVLNQTTVNKAVKQIGSLRVTRLVVTDSSGIAIYDSTENDVGRYMVLPEIVQALGGYDVFSWNYHDGAMQSRAATPIMSYDTLIGCVYMMEYDTQQGALIQNLQKNTFSISLFLELCVTIFAIFFSNSFTRRLRKIMISMRIIREGDYSHKVKMGGHDELTVLGNEFNDLVERLQISEQKRRNFVSDASHELKTPLASIKLLSDSILQNDMDAVTVKEFVGDIGNEADRLNRMTQKLLSLTRIESQEDSDCEIVYIAPTVDRVIRMLTGIAENNGITMQTDIIQDSSILIIEDDLYQIIFNLVENGIKYNTPGGKLTVTLYREEENAVIAVKDTGVGIPEESVGHVFERFYRVDKARARKTGGSGLGLSIVRNMVERNGGQIALESKVGEGSLFTLRFPVFDTEESQ